MKRNIFIVILLILGSITFQSCTDKKGTTDTLIKSGFHPIKVGGYGWFKGSQGDLFRTKFKAYSADSSQIVTGIVSKGIFKGKTIRLD